MADTGDFSMRKTIDSIVEKRKAKASKIFLTGGTGLVGSFLAVELLRRGYFVIILCRPTNKFSAPERIGQILSWHNYSGNNFEVVSGQITEDRFGINDEQYMYLLENVDEIWHCAADTTFSEKKRKQSEAVNIQGTLNVLKQATESNCYFFHFVSTAYVTGKRHGTCKEESEIQTEFHNVNEETKYKAEKMVIETCRKEGIRANIYRPSTIYGDSISGKSLQFKAFYVPVQTIHFLKNTLESDFNENNGVNAKKLGVIREGEQLHFTFRIGTVEGSSLDLVPIDFVCTQCMAIMESSLEGDIFHVVGGKPSTLGELIGFIERFFNIKGLRAAPDKEFTYQPETALETLGYSFIDVYRPHLSDTRIFENRKSAKISEKYNIACPPFDFDIFSKCVDYAIKVGWGKKWK
ncbi:SDR family oxidoreductase [Chloroflexota bacterium]